MFRLIRGAFGQRRKIFVNSVNATLGIPKRDIETALSQIGVDGRIRPEKLTLAQYAALSDILM